MSFRWASLLFGSSNRLEVLERLDPPGADTRDLADELSASKATVQRHVRQFLELGWVVKEDGSYERTPVGDRVLRLSEQYLADMSLLDEYGPTIEPLLNGDSEFDVALLSDATVVTATEDRPHAPLTAYRKRARAASPETIQCVVPVFSALLLDVCLQHARDGASVEIVATTGSSSHVVEWIRSELTAGAVDVYRSNRGAAISIVLLDETTFVGVHADNQLSACVVADGPALRRWAREEYRTCRDSASLCWSARTNEEPTLPQLEEPR